MSDINDCRPEFENLNMTATIMEGSEQGFSVYRVTATDCDFDPQNRNLTYSINGTDHGKIWNKMLRQVHIKGKL